MPLCRSRGHCMALIRSRMFEWLLLLILSFGMFHSKSNFIQLSNVVDDDNGNAVQFVPFGLMVLTCVCAYTENFIRIRLRMHIREETFSLFPSLSFLSWRKINLHFSFMCGRVGSLYRSHENLFHSQNTTFPFLSSSFTFSSSPLSRSMFSISFWNKWKTQKSKEPHTLTRTHNVQHICLAEHIYSCQSSQSSREIVSLSCCFKFFLFFLFLYFLLILIEDIATNIGYGLDGVESLRPECEEAQRLYTDMFQLAICNASNNTFC